MAKMKTEFELNPYSDTATIFPEKPMSKIRIVGAAPKYNPYVSIEPHDKTVFIQDKDLERLAVNILKALKSKHLKQ